jgi:hypothetical protein
MLHSRTPKVYELEEMASLDALWPTMSFEKKVTHRAGSKPASSVGKLHGGLHSIMASNKANQVEPLTYARDSLRHLRAAPPEVAAPLFGTWLGPHRSSPV